jgi:hypothetical protein
MDIYFCPISPSDAISFLVFYREVFEFGDKSSHTVGQTYKVIVFTKKIL